MQNMRLKKTMNLIYIFSLFPKQNISSETIRPHIMRLQSVKDYSNQLCSRKGNFIVLCY